MKIDFSDQESIGRALKEKGDGYVALEFARNNAREMTTMAEAWIVQVAAQTRFMYASFGLLSAMAVAVAVLFLTR